ncbi:MAG: SPOR domain-containing protein [Hyphomicrobiaceae bacterium]
MRIVRTVVMAGVMVALAPVSFAISEVQGAPKPKKSGKTAAKTAAQSVDAEAALDKARRALTDGKAQTAQQLADAVLLSPKKDTRSTARALAIRGEAHLQQGRAVEAIADLDSALWLKGGLAGQERESATAARAKAMQSSGIANGPPSRPETARAETTHGASSAWNNRVTVAPAVPTRQKESADRPVKTSASAGTARAALASSPAAEGSWSTAPRPVQQDASETTSGGGGITGFFSNLFGGGQSSGAPPETTGAVGPTPRPKMPAISSSEPQRITPAPRAHRANPQSKAAPAGAGAYKLQLAAVRSKTEAEAMAAKVRREDAALVGKRTVEIVEDVYGNMGRFYRVRIGSFSDVKQASTVCASLRSRQMDCVVLDR